MRRHELCHVSARFHFSQSICRVSVVPNYSFIFFTIYFFVPIDPDFFSYSASVQRVHVATAVRRRASNEGDFLDDGVFQFLISTTCP
jgi:hypothetical protein